MTEDGSWTNLQDLDIPSNGVAGYNQNSIHVSYIGGIDKSGKAKDTRSKEQHATFETCHALLKTRFPNATHHGHNEFANKACPSFRVRDWIKDMLG